MSKNLVIVESPAKAKTISSYLGDDFIVESSIGHVRDLPRSAKEIPAEYKKEKWGRLGVNVEGDFEPVYVINDKRKDQIKKLKQLMKSADKLYLATDEDREGEAIAWHLQEILKPPKDMEVHRMVFHEITREALEEAVKSPRGINKSLVNAQEARRILDRLYGYEVSPVLWRKIAQKLSAGRVQSVVKKLLVDREKERMSFVSASFTELKADFSFKGAVFTAVLEKLDKAEIAQSRDFDSNGVLKTKAQKTSESSKNTEAINLDANAAEALLAAVVTDGDGKAGKIKSKKSKPYTQRPSPPLTTSDLQQTVGNRLGLSSAMTMSAAQQLYEKGFITYMRTDANNLSAAALNSARQQIEKEFGGEYLSPKVRTYKNKAKNAQEAHEAIRPTGEVFKTPAEMAKLTAPALSSVYAVIYERTLASQMTDAMGETTTYKIAASSKEDGSDARELLFGVSGTVITHEGFRKARAQTKKKSTKTEDAENEEEVVLPQMKESDGLELISTQVLPKNTRPIARFTEASLVKELDDLGVGRPSTYASTIKTVLNRGYAWKKSSQIVPTFTAFAVVQLLERHFPDLVDPDFTARLEDTLDTISLGELESVQWLKDFYLGNNGSLGLQLKVQEEMGKIDSRAVSTIPLGKDESGRTIDVRVGKYGPFVSRSAEQEEGEEDTASIPHDIAPDEMTLEKAIEILDTPPYNELGKYEGEETEEFKGMTILALRGRYGPYVRIGTDEELEERGIDIKKAKTSSLFKTMDLESLTLKEAVQLLSLPRVVGSYEDKDIVAANGPFGPYIKHGRETRQLESENRLLEVNLDDCIALLSQPKSYKKSRGGSTLRDIGKDPMTDKNMSVKSGRFGFYVADGEINASLMDTDDPQTITTERASELLSARRERLEGGG